MKSNNLYCCFSRPLVNFLSENNIRYEMSALSEKTHKTMWIYMKTEKLNELLKQWSSNRPD